MEGAKVFYCLHWVHIDSLGYLERRKRKLMEIRIALFGVE